MIIEPREKTFKELIDDLLPMMNDRYYRYNYIKYMMGDHSNNIVLKDPTFHTTNYTSAFRSLMDIFNFNNLTTDSYTDLFSRKVDNSDNLYPMMSIVYDDRYGMGYSFKDDESLNKVYDINSPTYIDTRELILVNLSEVKSYTSTLNNTQWAPQISFTFDERGISINNGYLMDTVVIKPDRVNTNNTVVYLITYRTSNGNNCSINFIVGFILVDFSDSPMNPLSKTKISVILTKNYTNIREHVLVDFDKLSTQGFTEESIVAIKNRFDSDMKGFINETLAILPNNSYVIASVNDMYTSKSTFKLSANNTIIPHKYSAMMYNINNINQVKEISLLSDKLNCKITSDGNINIGGIIINRGAGKNWTVNSDIVKSTVDTHVYAKYIRNADINTRWGNILGITHYYPETMLMYPFKDDMNPLWYYVNNITYPFYLRMSLVHTTNNVLKDSRDGVTPGSEDIVDNYVVSWLNSNTLLFNPGDCDGVIPDSVIIKKYGQGLGIAGNSIYYGDFTNNMATVFGDLINTLPESSNNVSPIDLEIGK